MTHNNLNSNNNNQGFIISNNANSDSNSLENHEKHQDNNLNEYLNGNNSLSENNTSVEEKCDITINQEEKKMSKKRKHRRGKKRRNQRFTPYGLSNSEYEKKECEKIQRNREKMVKQGKTLAPFNTTQFIMDEHRDEIQQTIDSFNSSDLDSDTTGEDKCLNNDFNEEYEIIKLDYYRNLNKDQLLNECLQILNELNKLQDTVAKLTSENEKLKVELTSQSINGISMMN